MTAEQIATIISGAYSSTVGGATPSTISKGTIGQTAFNRYEWHDESILISTPSKSFAQPGIEQYYEEDTETYDITIATLTSITRYKQIEDEVRRISLAFAGDNNYSRIHVDDMGPIDSPFYYAYSGGLHAYKKVSRVRTQ